MGELLVRRGCPSCGWEGQVTVTFTYGGDVEDWTCPADEGGCGEHVHTEP